MGQKGLGLWAEGGLALRIWVLGFRVYDLWLSDQDLGA